jgi:hypothetical protein
MIVQNIVYYGAVGEKIQEEAVLLYRYGLNSHVYTYTPATILAQILEGIGICL